MKHVFLSALLAVLFFNALEAQDSKSSSSSNFNFGTRWGADVYNISTSQSAIKNTKFYVGVFAKQQITASLALQLEANYYWESVLQVPLLLKYKLFNRLSLYGGASADISFAQQSTPNRTRNKALGCSVILGASYELSPHWSIEARFNQGLTKQFPFYSNFDNPLVFGKRRSFSFGLAYKL